MRRWPLRKLGDVATVTAGTSAPQGDQYFKGGQFNFVRTQDVGRCGFTTSLIETKDRVNELAIREKRLKKVRKGASVFPKSGASILTNSRAVLGCDSYVVSHLAIVDANQTFLDDYYLHYFLRSVDFSKIAQSEEGYPSLRLSEISELNIPIPPIDEQRRIVSRIEELTRRVEEVRKLRQDTMKKVKGLLQTELERIFSPIETDNWTEYKAQEVFDIIKGQVDPREEPYASMPHVAPDIIEIGTGKLLFDKVKTAKELELKSGKYLFDASHVLYSKIRPNLRKVALPEFEGTCSADMYPLIPNTKVVTREFLALVLLSSPFTAYAVENSDRNAMPKVNRPTMFNYRVKLPKKSEQQEIVLRFRFMQEKAEKILKLQNDVEEELVKLQSALLAKAFRGEL